MLEVCKSLMEHANRLRKHVEEDNNGVMKLSASVNETLKRACLGYEAASKTYPELHHNYGRPKGPFTGEANVNISMPHTSIPFTACHEMAHQIGFAREDEAYQLL